MRLSVDEIVRTVIAHHVQVAPATIDRGGDLQRDLDLAPLDLVVIALVIEEMTGCEFPIGRLEEARTVADLSRIVKALDPEREEQNGFTLDELPESIPEADDPGTDPIH